MKKNLIFILTMICVILYFTFDKYNFLELTFFSIIIISLINIFIIIRYQKISMYLVYWFFQIIFFYLVPMMQYKNDKFRFIKIDFATYDDMILINLLILLFNLIFMVFYYINYFKTSKNTIIEISTKEISIIRSILFIFVISLVFIYIYKVLGLSGFFFRKSEDVKLSQIIYLFYNYFFKPLIFYTALLYLIKYKYKKIGNIYLLIFLIISALIFNFPTGSARFYVFALILSLYTAFLMKEKINSLILMFYFIIALFGSSFFNIFRFVSSDIKLNSVFDLNYFYDGHFDAYENFILTFRYSYENSIVYGHSILSAILFFIPRSIWPDKGIGSGALIAQKYLDKMYTITNDNLSNPYISEWYLNFSYLGIIISAIIYGYIIAKIDVFFKFRLNNNIYENKVILIFYGFLIGLFFFHLRGDFMSSYAYTFSSIVSYIIALKLLNYKISFKKGKN